MVEQNGTDAQLGTEAALLYAQIASTVPSAVRGHEKVRTFGHEKSAPVATRSPQLWPSDVLTPR